MIAYDNAWKERKNGQHQDGVADNVWWYLFTKGKRDGWARDPESPNQQDGHVEDK